MTESNVVAFPSAARLLPCPFCGESDSEICDDEHGDVWAQCEMCGAQGPQTRVGCRSDDQNIDLEAEAIELWNKREAKP